MPKLAENNLCSGCSACYVACPKGAISMIEDFEGFFRPEIDSNICVECGVCEKACHVVSPYPERRPIEVFAAKANSDDIRYSSSSGGIFPLLAEKIISEGGIVWGVKWNRSTTIPYAEHGYTENLAGLKEFRGSKYVQSKIEDTYITVKSQLREGRKVLFSGTPCQISGLKHYLGKDYENLFCCEVICHGVPSPKIFHDFIATLLSDNGKEYLIKDISFRNKIHRYYGWRRGVALVVTVSEIDNNIENDIIVSDKTADDDVYLRGFLEELINRPSCQNCTVRNLKSGADITLGDFWKVQKYAPQIDDDMGVSLVLLNTEKGRQLYSSINSDLSANYKFNWEAAVDSTGALIQSPKSHRNRSKFFKYYSKKGFRSKIMKRMLRPTLKQIFDRGKRMVKNILRPYVNIIKR